MCTRLVARKRELPHHVLGLRCRRISENDQAATATGRCLRRRTHPPSVAESGALSEPPPSVAALSEPESLGTPPEDEEDADDEDDDDDEEDEDEDEDELSRGSAATP